MDARPQTPRLTNRRDAMGNVLDIVNDDLLGKFHEIHQRLQGEEDNQTTTGANSSTKKTAQKGSKSTTTATSSSATSNKTPRQLVEDRSVLRSPRFHARRNALDDPTSAAAVLNDRALCSRFRQLELMTHHTTANATATAR